MDGWAFLAIALVLVVGAGLIAAGRWLWKGEGLQFVAGNQNDFYDGAGRSEQTGLGKTVGAMMIAIGAICVLSTAVVAFSMLAR